MPITPTYPGIYIEELPSSARTITAAATSITVFVGYTHPFKTKTFGKAVRIFNFTEYEREFGGHFVSGDIPADVPKAVDQFFLNGGSDAYVIGINANVTNPTVPINNIDFTPLEPIDSTPITVTINNLSNSEEIEPTDPAYSADMADIIIVYDNHLSPVVEEFRGVTLTGGPNGENFIKNRINEKTSLLVTVDFDPASGTEFTNTYEQNLNSPYAFSFNQRDFRAVFDNDSSLDKVPIFNLLVIPGITDHSILSAALAFCERKQAFLILDPPRQAVADSTNVPPGESDDDFLMGNLMTKTSSPIPKSTNGAIYFPYLRSLNPITGEAENVPPSGFVAGVYARTDLNRGVWKAPAGMETTLLNTTGVVDSGRMTDERQGTLNPIGVNCLRSFPGIGTVVYGARTLRGSDTDTAFKQWKYVPVRRMALFIEQTLYRNLGWVVFEPNDEPLWAAIRTSIEGFMLSLFTQGAFQGSTPSQAFQVKCDSSTTTQTDIENGTVNIIVAFAPLKPAEFVIIKIAQLAGQVQS